MNSTSLCICCGQPFKEGDMLQAFLGSPYNPEGSWTTPVLVDKEYQAELQCNIKRKHPTCVNPPLVYGEPKYAMKRAKIIRLAVKLSVGKMPFDTEILMHCKYERKGSVTKFYYKGKAIVTFTTNQDLEGKITEEYKYES